jgi:hypothetical protein
MGPHLEASHVTTNAPFLVLEQQRALFAPDYRVTRCEDCDQYSLYSRRDEEAERMHMRWSPHIRVPWQVLPDTSDIVPSLSVA